MFSVGTNFDTQLLNSLKEYSVYEIYGKLPVDPIGGCRQSILIKPITIKELTKEVDRAHQYNIKFNYVLNSTCLGNIEYSRKGTRKIVNFLDLLTKINVDTLTVAVPFLVKFIKENYPHFKIDISTLAGVNTIKKFKYWQDLGADTITLDIAVNRDFNLIKNIIKNNFKSDVKIIVNQACELECINYNYHSNILSHQTTKKNQFPLEYCNIACKLNRIKNISTLIKAPWIRPEDLKIYKDLGIKKFKIVQRQDPTDKIIRAVNAYQQEKYKGNLLDIMTFVLGLKNIRKIGIKKIIHQSKFFIKPNFYNIIKLAKNIKLFDDDFDLCIDNNKLNGFIDFFLYNNCKEITCNNCNYCEIWANKAIVCNTIKRNRLIENYTKLQKLFINKKESLFL